jgi:hypothetical protein
LAAMMLFGLWKRGRSGTMFVNLLHKIDTIWEETKNSIP